MPATRNILLTGYWPPTNEMLRSFSTNAAQNPDGWQGGNWRGQGFDLHAFFPEFPEETWPAGVGDFRVDYGATSADWVRITSLIRPCAIITFSRGSPGVLWEIELRQRNLAVWRADHAGNQPVPCPPDSTYAPDGVRASTLPAQLIQRRVQEAIPELTAFCDFEDFGGAYLSEFIAYHGVWYQAVHHDTCFAAGHIHVGMDVALPMAMAATDVTLRALIDYLLLFEERGGPASLA
jgi:hypothetical protein